MSLWGGGLEMCAWRMSELSCDSSRVSRVLCFVCMEVRQQGRTGACCNPDILFFCGAGVPRRAEVAEKVFQAVENGRFALPPSQAFVKPIPSTRPAHLSAAALTVPESHQRQQRAGAGLAEGCPDVAVSARS